MSFQVYSYPFNQETSALFPTDLDLIIGSIPIGYDRQEVLQKLNARFPKAHKHLATSCRGSFNQRQVHLDQTITLFGISDPEGAYGSAAGEINEHCHIQSLVYLLLETASLRAGRSGELPHLVWMSASPGNEEQIISAIQSFYNTDVLICGGSAADDHIEGKWWIADQLQIHSSGVVLSVLYSTVNVFTRFSSGYFMTDQSGTITECETRKIKKIDHQPAALIYNQWNQNRLSHLLKGGKILEESTYSPLAVQQGAVGTISYFQVIHPKEIEPDQSITTFANVHLGEQLYLLSGDEESLVGRASRVVRGVLIDADCQLQHVKGALIIFCAGCFLAVQHRIDDVWKQIQLELPSIPLLGQFTFGEQGIFPQGECVHGNLMISVVLFVDSNL